MWWYIILVCILPVLSSAESQLSTSTGDDAQVFEERETVLQLTGKVKALEENQKKSQDHFEKIADSLQKLTALVVANGKAVTGIKEELTGVKRELTKIKSVVNENKKGNTDIKRRISDVTTDEISVILAAGATHEEYIGTCEVIKVTRNTNGNLTLETRSIAKIPEKLNDYFDNTYMVKMGLNEIFLKLKDHGYTYQWYKNQWIKAENSGMSPRAYATPVVSFDNGFLTLGTSDPPGPEIRFYNGNFNYTVVGAFPDYYYPTYSHMVTKVGRSSFIVTGGSRGTHGASMRGSLLGTLIGGKKVRWTPLQDMIYARYRHCSFTLGSKVIVLGNWGYHEQTVEYFEIASNMSMQHWKRGPDLPHHISDPTCHVSEKGTFAIIVGGRWDNTVYDKVLVMYPDLSIKEASGRLLERRSGHSAVPIRSTEMD